MDDEVNWSGSSNNKGPTIILIALFATVIGSLRAWWATACSRSPSWSFLHQK